MTTSPDPSISAFLSGDLSPEELKVFEQRLTESDELCADLQRQTAGVKLWDDVRAYLSSTEDIDDFKPAAFSIDFLAPTDDPRMLGRFAGYEISGVIGCGGMGIVLKGFDVALNRYAAIKVLAPHFATSGAARQRFEREAQAAAAVVHDNVIAIHGVDEFNGLPYLVMPYIKGESLQRRIDNGGPLAITEALRIASQCAKGLAAAHDQGLVHRDIKPGNILLPEGVERVLITDFGLARAADDASLTRSGVIAGTPQYMSPEQAAGEPIDHRSDLFSLGSVMYTMCCGHPPFRAETPYGILRRITDHQARPLREINAEVPAWLESLIAQLLQKSPEKRPSSAAEVATLLEDCLAHVQHPHQVPLPEQLAGSNRRRWPMVAYIFAALAAIVFFMPPSPREGRSSAPGRATASGNAIAQSSHHSPSDEPRSAAAQQPANPRSDHKPSNPSPPLDSNSPSTASPAPLVTRSDDGYMDADDLRWDTFDDFKSLEEKLTDLRRELNDKEEPNDD